MKKNVPLLMLLVIVNISIIGCGASHTHTWVEANCVAPKHCEGCGQTIGEALGHNWKDATCTEPKICTRCGKTEGKALGHDISDLSCTASSTCKRCGESFAALGHDWIDATCQAPKTCAKCGETEGSALGHEWIEATCTDPKKCSRCGETEGSALGHNWNEPTCTEPKKCTKCGVTDGDALGHLFSEGKCSRCGAYDPDYIPPESYESNKYYDIVEEATFENSIGYTIVVQKVIAKQNASIEATLLAFDTNGDVIGKSTDKITLTEGKANYFRFSFENDISKATIQSSWKYEEDSFLIGERNAVEMVKYNQAGNDLYITFKQTGDDLGSFARFKLLFYKGNKIVDEDEGSFIVYAKNLSGKGSTDVASIWAYGIEYDRIEYIFEP